MAFKTTIIKGETISISLEVTSGSDELVGATISSVLKKAVNNAPPPEAAPVLLTFTTEWRDELGTNIGPGWVLEADTSSLAVGTYITDARITLADGFVDYAEPVVIEIKGRVTVA